MKSSICQIFFPAILSQDIGCKPRKVLIPIDAPRYQYYPRFAEVFRCGGACSTLSPNIQQCQAATWNNLTGQIFDLSQVTDALKEAAFENHTSCQCECVVKAEDCSENEVYKREQCNCECKYENEPPPPCPERFTYVSLLLITISIFDIYEPYVSNRGSSTPLFVSYGIYIWSVKNQENLEL